MRIGLPARSFMASLSVVFCCLALLNPTVAQESGGSESSQRMMSSRFLPPDAFLVMDLHPAKALENDLARFLPTEVIELWCEENVGVQAKDVSLLRMVAVMPEGPNSAKKFGGVVVFKSDVEISQLNEDLVDRPDKVEIEGKTCYRIVGGEPGYIMPLSPRLWLMGTEEYLPQILAASDAESAQGNLAQIVESVPVRGHIQVALDLEPAKPIMRMGVMSQAKDIPPSMARLPELINHVDAWWTTIDLSTFEWLSYGEMVFRSPTAQSADQVEQILAETVENVRVDLVAKAMSELTEPTKMNDAWQQYVQRVSLEITPLLKLRREGRLFRAPEFTNTPGIAFAGMAAGMLLPAIQAARDASRRMSASNNLKQLGLAMHNYHSAFRKLPKASSTDDDGKQLLSWRVAILPFIEQQPLYERFHLDEPWDSEHNISLLDEMPNVFEEPSVSLESGMTLYHAPVGAGMIYQTGTDQPRFRDILDGLSNTIMIYEGAKGSAVPWTKPVDLNTDLTNPLSTTGDNRPGGFHVLMGDGAVRFINAKIDQQLFKGLLTRAGKERIGDF